MDIAVAGPARHERGNWTQTAARATAMPIHGADAIGPLPVTVPVPSLPVLSLLSVHPGALRPRGEAVIVTGWRRPAGPVSCQAVAWPGRRGDHGSIRAAGARRMDEKGRQWAMAATVLVAEDEQRLRELVRSYLELAGSAVLSTGSGAEAITIAADASPDLVVPDLDLPDVPGETVARELPAAAAAAPIVMLTAKAADEEQIAGLELGSDDYVIKPSIPRELVLRIQAVLRRGGPAAAQGVASYGERVLVIDEPRREVTVRDAAAELTPTEWGILAALATVPGRVYSRYELINRLRGYEFAGYERTVDSHVKNLRRKIGDDPSDPRIVQIALGGGYRLGLARDE